MLKETGDLKVHKVQKDLRVNQADLDQLDYKDLGVWLEDLDYQEKMAWQEKEDNLELMENLENLDLRVFKVFLD